MKLPSLQQETSLVWSGDPALDTPSRMEGESDEGWGKRSDEWSEKLKRARQTGQWDGLTRSGSKLTQFVVGYVPKKAWGKFEDRVTRGDIGANEASALAFLMALRSVSELDDFERKPFKVEFRSDEEYGRMAKDSVLDLLDAYLRLRREEVKDVSDPVVEMGFAVLARQRGVDPL